MIASEEYGRQICPGWLVVQPQGHQRHWLDDPKAILDLLHEANHLFTEHVDQIGGPTLDRDAKARMEARSAESGERRIVTVGGLIRRAVD